MNQQGFLIFVLLLVSWNAAVSKTVTVNSEYLYNVPANVSTEEAKEIALYRAKVQAIADEFGTYVSQSTSVTVDNLNGNSHTDFMSLGGSELKGEWIEDLQPPTYEILTDGSNLVIKVRIKGKIRDVMSARIPLNVKILQNGLTDAAEADKFISGDDMYASFSSPVSGFLAVYLIDASGNAYCLLPYESQTEGIFSIKANKRYLLFCPDSSGDLKPDIVDSFTLETENEIERNKIVFVFSPNRFYKGNDMKQAVDCPRQLSMGEFQKWLSDVKGKDKNLQTIEKVITIFPKK